MNGRSRVNAARMPGYMLAILLAVTQSAAAYDYAQKMACVSGLPLAYPLKPFVLRFSQEDLTSQPIWATHLDGIIIPTNAPSPIRIGCRAIQDAMRTVNATGTVAIIEVAPDQRALPEALAGNYLIAGIPDAFALARAMVQSAKLDISDGALNGDGFVVKPITKGKLRTLLITAAEARGVLYGMYELEERTTSRGIPLIDQRFVPAVRYRNWAAHTFVDEPPDVGGRLRLNLSLVFDLYWPSTLSYDAFPELLGKANAARIHAQQAKLHQKFENAVAYGAIPTLCWNPLTFCLAPASGPGAQWALAQAHPGMLARPWSQVADWQGRRNLCPSHPATRLYVASAVKEFVAAFPEVQMMMLYFSDQSGELLCGCDQCRKYPYVDRIVDYTQLIVRTARHVNPRLRFMMRMHGLNSFIPILQPEYRSDPTAGFRDITRRLGPDLEAVEMRVTSPPGGDFNSWFSGDSTMLGHGIPLYFFFHYYEAGGPGIVAPLSPIESHWSWQLPICVRKLREFVRPGVGMVGGDVDMAGMEVAYWHPDLDANRYMRNWCVAKYGPAGEDVFAALADSDKVTSALYPQTKVGLAESCDLYRWGDYGQPWATKMLPLEQAGIGTAAILELNAVKGFMRPHAPQPDALRHVKAGALAPWLQRFDVARERKIAGRAHAAMERALARDATNRELQRLEIVTAATEHLIDLYREYHTALAYANAARQADATAAKTDLAGKAEAFLLAASDNVWKYQRAFWPLTRDAQFGRLNSDVRQIYVATLLATVREACFLFDRDFPGHATLSHFDGKLLGASHAADQAPPAVNIRTMKYTPRSKDQAIQWQREVRAKLLRRLKMADLVAAGHAIPFAARKLFSTNQGEYVLQEWEINSTATRRIRIVLATPTTSATARPAVVGIGGHSSDRYSVFDPKTVTRKPLAWDEAYKGFGTALAEKGYMVISTDVSQHQIYESGRTLMGERLWDLMRCVDYLISLPQVDRQRIGCAGLSLGGEMAMWLGAMDERISATVSAGILTYIDNLYLKKGACQCFNFDGLRELVDFPDIFALTAPRPLQCENGLQDNPWFSVSLARPALAEIRQTYADLGQPGNVVLDAHPAGHIIDLPALVDFFDRHLHTRPSGLGGKR